MQDKKYLYPILNFVEIQKTSYWNFNNLAVVVFSDENIFKEVSNNNFLKGDISQNKYCKYYFNFSNISDFIETATKKTSGLWENTFEVVNIFLLNYKIENKVVSNKLIFHGVKNCVYPDSEQLDLAVKDKLINIEHEWTFQEQKEIPLLSKNKIYWFFENHFNSYQGDPNDFLNHSEELINNIWKDKNLPNLKRKKYFNEWLNEKKIELQELGFESIINSITPQETLSIEASSVNASTAPANKSLNLNKIVNDINNAFFRLESFMKGMKEYEYFGFNNAFTLLFNEVKKPINFTISNCELIDQYWYLIQQVSFDFDKGNYDNEEASNNAGFCQDCNEMGVLMGRVVEFIYFGGTEEEPKISIKDIIKKSSLSKTQQAPAPRQEVNASTVPANEGLTDDQKVIWKHIEHLKGNNNSREKIMTDENFNQLFEDLCYLVENDKVPTIKNPLPQMGISNQSIIYTMRLIHTDLFTTNKIRPSFISFLEMYFHQLNSYENMKVAFSKKPPKLYPF